MARKRPFKFDFDEDADPVEELHRLRAATMKHFKTLDALMEYYRSTPPVEEILAELEKEIAENKAKDARPKKVKTTRRRKTAKRPVHA